MDRVTLDSTLSRELGAAAHPIELCDEAGRTLGFFMSKQEFYALLESPVSDEELDRRVQAGGGRPWREIRSDLEKQYGPAGA